MAFMMTKRHITTYFLALVLFSRAFLPAADEASNDSSRLIAQEEGEAATPGQRTPARTLLINFNNVVATEFIRFISQISGKNFIFDEADLQFQVTIVSEEPTSLDNIMAALLQELRVHGLSITEQGNNLIIHRNPGVTAISNVIADNLPVEEGKKSEIVTRLFRLNTADPDKVATILKPLMSEKAIIEVFKDTNHLIVTDLTTNIDEVAKLVRSLDSPNNGLVIGQYSVRSGFIDSLVQLAQRIMQPISQDQILTFVPHRAANSIFIVSTPFMMEKTIALLQYLDQNQGSTRIFDLNNLKFAEAAAAATEGATTPGVTGARPEQWELDAQGNWVFRPAGVPQGGQPPQGSWYIDDQGNWRFRLGAAAPAGASGLAGPEGEWRLDPQGIWVFQLAPGRTISPERLARPIRGTADLPLGHIERTQFSIYKLRYRRGDQIAVALGRIAFSLRPTQANLDLVQIIDSVQWIEASNALIFTGTAESIAKITALIEEIDTPLRQVFIEMLILDTTLEDSLNYGVDWETAFGGGGTAGAQGFFAPGSPLPGAIVNSGIDPITGLDFIPDARGIINRPGFSLGIIGTHLTHCGLRFSSIGALVRAVHDRTDAKIVLSPKILTEDNVPAEIFVGINTPFPTQAITNDRGEIITQNFEFRDVGTRLRVTPLIGDNDIITLIVEEENSSVLALTILTANTAGLTTRKATTRTRFHLPNEYFIVISGMMEDNDTLTVGQVPCLGGVPFLGGGFKNWLHRDQKRNVMLFIRPRIIDTEEEIQNLTKHEQDLYLYKSTKKPMWIQEYEEALDYFNLPQCEDCNDDCCVWPGRINSHK